MTHTDGAPATVVLLGEPLVVMDSDPELLAVATTLELSFGGSEFNTAVGLARLGVRPRLTTSLGTDVLSRRLIDLARAEGVDLVIGSAAGTSWSIGAMFKDLHGPEGETFYLRNNSAFSEAMDADFPVGVIGSDTSWFHTSGITWAVNEALTTAFLRRAADTGARISVDINLRSDLHPGDAPRRLFEAVSPHCDVLLLSLKEARAITGTHTVSAAVRAISGVVPRAVIRNGPEPLLAVEGTNVTEVPVTPVAEVDPIGAGDAFNAGYIAGTLAGMGLEESCRLGAELAGEVVAVRGDWGFAPRLLAPTARKGVPSDAGSTSAATRE